MRLPGGKTVLLVWFCSLLAAVPLLHGQSVRQISSSRVIELTPALREGDQPPVISGVAVQPGGRLMATVGDDHIVRIWDLSDGQLLRKLESHVDWVRVATFSPDGRVLATAGNDRQVIFWDPETGKVLSALPVQEAVSTLVYAPDGTRLAMAGFGSELGIYDTEAGKIVRTFNCPCHDMRCLAFSPRGNQLAAAGGDGQIHLWQLPDGELLYDVKASRRRIWGLAFARDGRQLIAAGEDRMIHVLRADDGTELFHLAAQPAKVLALVAYAPDRLATAGSDNEIRLWDLAARRETARLSGHTGSVSSLDCQGGLLFSGSFDTTVRIWPVDDEAARDDRAERINGPRVR